MVMVDSKMDTEAGEYDQSFPAKLHYFLQMVEDDGLNHIVSFQPHGRAFLVKDKKRFVGELLQKWFRQHHWASFQRQLNIYQFKRITCGRDKGAYYHPYFLSGYRGLCRFIKCVKVKGLGPRKPNCPESEPDFYQYPALPSVLPTADEQAAAVSFSLPDLSPSTAVSAAATEAHFGRTESTESSRRLITPIHQPARTPSFSAADSPYLSLAPPFPFHNTNGSFPSNADIHPTLANILVSEIMKKQKNEEAKKRQALHQHQLRAVNTAAATVAIANTTITTVARGQQGISFPVPSFDPSSNNLSTSLEWIALRPRPVGHRSLLPDHPNVTTNWEELSRFFLYR